MIKRVLLVLLGAVGALEAARWSERLKNRYRPSAVTGTLLDMLNARLEANRSRAHSPSDSRS